MKKTRIVTHNGKAHRDEFLACCVILFHEYRQGRLCFIERRLVGDSDLACKDTWVVDTGGIWCAAFHNYDHHQSDPSLAGMCALDLVMIDILGQAVYDTYKAVNPWVRLTANHDTLGIHGAANSIGVDMKAYLATRSPVEKAMLSQFGDSQVVHMECPLAYCMREVGRVITLEAESWAKDVPEMLADAPPPFDHAGMRVWDVRHAWADDDTPASVAMMNRAAGTRGVDVVISKNNRTGGVGIYRQPWADSKLDLSRIQDEAGVKFAHKNGFFAILSNEVSNTGINRLLRLASSQVAETKEFIEK